MANRTDPNALSVHGTNPQNLIEKILRMRIYSNSFWKESCFGLTAETMVDKAMDLDMFGGTYGGSKRPTKFICLVLKLLQIQPEKEIIVEFIKNEDYRYVRLLGAFYLRLVGRPVDIYNYLEPLYNDFRRLRKKADVGYTITHMDEFIDELLHEDYSCDITLPHLPRRHTLEQSDQIPPRISALDDEDIPNDDEDAANEKNKDKERSHRDRDHRDRDRDRDRDRHRDRDRDRDGNRDRDSHRDRDKDRERDKDGNRERDRDRDRDREKDRDKNVDRDRERERERDINRDRDKDRDRDRDKERDRRESNREREGNRDRDRDRDRDRKKDDKSTDKDRSKKAKVESKGDRDSLSVSDMNKLRAELGLGPLK